MQTDSEDRIQQQIVQWYTNTYCLKHHNPRYLILSIPNGGSRNAIEATHLKATGLLPGASDLIVVHGPVVLWVEVKTPTGKQSEVQLEFQKRVVSLGYEYVIVRSLEDFKQLINKKILNFL